MKQRPWKRALSLMLAFALVFAMPCVTGVYAAGEPVDYIERWWDEDEQKVMDSQKSVTNYTEVESSTTAWDGDTTGGWYVVSDNVEITSRVTVTGDVHLLLMDGCILTVNGGIQVKDDDSLTIYGQEKGSGTVEAIGSQSAAGIGGGDSYESGGTVTIMGGIVEATGDEYAAGIGGGAWGGDGGTVTILGGTVTATSDSVTQGGAGIGGGGDGGDGGTTRIYGGTVTARGSGGSAGIGGGYSGDGGTVIITGGKVEATGAFGAAGIGGGNGSSYTGHGGSITITGGEVKATGGDQASGIGGGSNGSGGDITITGGTVTATGGNGDSGNGLPSNGGAGIGGGWFGAGGNVTISGGTVTATGGSSILGEGGAGIGGGDGNGTFSTTAADGTPGTAVIYAAGGTNASAIDDQSEKDNWSGILFAKDGGVSEYTGAVYGDQTLQKDLTLPNGKDPQTLTVKEGASLTVPDGKTLTVKQGGELHVDSGGKLNVDKGGTLQIQENGSVTNDGAIHNAGTISGTVGGSGSLVQYVTSVTLEPKTLSLTVGETAALTAAVEPDNASNKAVEWNSDDTSVATVTENADGTATVTAVSAGKATITVTAKDGSGASTSCTVTVKNPDPDPDPDPGRPSGGSGGSDWSEPSIGAEMPVTEPGGTEQGGSGQSGAFSQPAGCVSDTLGEVNVSGAYQFRLTSTNGTAPVVELDSTNFRAVLASQEGNDYFWKIYAVGLPGQLCTVTVNGTAVARLTLISSIFGGVSSDTTAPFTVPQGGSYQFCLTAVERPKLSAGSSSFVVEYVGNEGFDWFFRVVAVGKPGDGCGFYINGAPVPVAIAHIS